MHTGQRAAIQEAKYREMANYFQTMPGHIATNITLGNTAEMQANVDGITIPLHGVTVPPSGFREWVEQFPGAALTGINDVMTDSVSWAVKVKVDMPRPV